MHVLTLLKRSLLGQILALIFVIQFVIVSLVFIHQNFNTNYPVIDKNSLESRTAAVSELVQSLYFKGHFSNDPNLPSINNLRLKAAWADVKESNKNLSVYIEDQGFKFEMGTDPIGLDDFNLNMSNISENLVTCSETQRFLKEKDVVAYAISSTCDSPGSMYIEVGNLSEQYIPSDSFYSVIVPPILGWRQLLWSFLSLSLLMPLVLFYLLRPIRRTSEAARNFVFGKKNSRLPTRGLHAEVLGLVESVNMALRRLDQGFVREQRLRSAIAHELRSPLTVLRARLENLEETPLRDELIGDTRKITNLIDRILEFSRVASETDKLSELNLIAAVRAACADCGKSAMEANIDMDFTHDNLESIPVKVHPMVVQLVVTNLINNAIFHSQSKAPIEIRVEKTAEVIVRDYGTGLPNNLVTKLNRTDDDGSYELLSSMNGFGLVIVVELMRLIGGKLRCESPKDGKSGTKFILKFPTDV